MMNGKKLSFIVFLVNESWNCMFEGCNMVLEALEYCGKELFKDVNLFKNDELIVIFIIICR